jgi:hypothetical protein
MTEDARDNCRETTIHDRLAPLIELKAQALN